MLKQIKSDLEFISVAPRAGGGTGASVGSLGSLTGDTAFEYFKAINGQLEALDESEIKASSPTLYSEARVLCDNIVQSQHTAFYRCRQALQEKSAALKKILGLKA